MYFSVLSKSTVRILYFDLHRGLADLSRKSIDKQGISKKFLDYIHSLDKTVGERALGPDQTLSSKIQTTVGQAAQQARAVDEQKGFSKIANDVCYYIENHASSNTHSFSLQYYQKAIASPFGQKVKAFYTDTSKQVLDIHEEARRIADQEKAHAAQVAAETPQPATSAAPEPKA